MERDCCLKRGRHFEEAGRQEEAGTAGGAEILDQFISASV